MQPIMLATDGSPSAEAATAEALGLAQALELPLVIATVAHETTSMYGGYYALPELVAEQRKLQLGHAAEVLATVESEAAEAGVPCTTLLLEGQRGQALCSAARRRDARLLVVGAHGWDRLGRLIHGSVSTYVLHHAPCPVLVVDERAVAAREHAATAAAVA